MQWHRHIGWKPGDLGWRIAVLFMVGSLVFAVGSFPAYAQLMDPAIVGVTFFIGSLFFTTAGYSQFLQTINDDVDNADAPFRFWAWQPGSKLWWATVIQLAGTLFFNISTFDAMLGNLSVQETNHLVWAPDFFGSIAFLVASHLGWLVVCKRLWCVHSGDADWWSASLNYTGSIFFMLSALAALTLPATGEPINVTLVNSATFVGAACFFVGAYLLAPPVRSHSAPSSGSGS